MWFLLQENDFPSFRSSWYFLLICASLAAPNAWATDVAFAGFAYSGEHQSIAERFPLTKQYDASLGTAGVNGILRTSMQTIQPKNFTLVPDIAKLDGRDQAIAVALVMTSETVTTEQIGADYKVLVQLRGQAMFFDFKSMTVIRTYPVSFTYIDALPAAPTTEQKVERIGHVFNGINGKPGILQRFFDSLTRATIPDTVPRFVQVTAVTISDQARAQFPQQYQHGAAETWIADTLGEAISTKMGIPILPYATGYAVSKVMSIRINDSTVYNLKLPKPDYEFTVNIAKLKKILYSDKPAGKTFIYGTIAEIDLVQGMSRDQPYLRTALKNGEIKVAPATQANTEDFPAFADSMRGLFAKLTAAIAGDDKEWLKSATDNKDIDKQIALTRELLKSCK